MTLLQQRYEQFTLRAPTTLSVSIRPVWELNRQGCFLAVLPSPYVQTANLAVISPV
jgi:hypothetical protein